MRRWSVYRREKQAFWHFDFIPLGVIEAKSELMARIAANRHWAGAEHHPLVVTEWATDAMALGARRPGRMAGTQPDITVVEPVNQAGE